LAWSARVTPEMFVHPGREGVDARTELRTLSLDRTEQVAAMSLDGNSQVPYPCLDSCILSVDPVALGVDPGARTHPEGTDPGAKIEGNFRTIRGRQPPAARSRSTLWPPSPTDCSTDH
jgi:hypothetical protein